ncbi:MAG TPA: cell envelope integrity protein TolA, partial [Chthoniobacterales bacterium]|nr:cell envelope integrity protein TolA [Chthoniobacterales bacterium]
MKKIFALLLVIALSIFSSCQKQQTDAERQAEIDRQVQQRLDAEHQAQEKEKLAQREDELNAREKALAEKQDAVAKSSQRESRPTHTERATRTDDHRPTATASYDTFYTQLDRYGDWRETSDYGYVWQPRQAQSRTWRPYTDGHWVYTDVGWTWVSEEPFGWATYHYGRWTRLRNIGWVWVPGDEWAPAWVSWRKSNDYVGWAPLPPEARFDRGTGIHNWSDSYYDVGPDQYCFVETKQFGAPRLESAVVRS